MVVTNIALNSYHQLSPKHVYMSPRLPIAEMQFSSIEMAMWFVALTQDNKWYLADEMTRQATLREQPGRIHNWLWSRGYQMSARIVWAARMIYYDIMVFLLRHPQNPFKTAFLNTVGDRLPQETRFTLGSDKDYLWSAGLRVPAIYEYDAANMRYPGFNIIGHLLGRLFHAHTNAALHYDLVDDFESLFRGPVTIALAPEMHKLSVLILSDSTCRQIAGVHGGEVHARSGYTYKDLATYVMENDEISVFDFEVLIVQAGIVETSRKDRMDSWDSMRRLLLSYVAHGFAADKIIVSLPVPHPDVGLYSVEDFSVAIKASLEGTGIHTVGWSADDSPFFSDGHWSSSLYFGTGFHNIHLRHAGLREMWRRWAETIPFVGLVPYLLSYEFYLGQ